MKKYLKMSLTLLLVIAMLLPVLAGCGGKNGETEPTDQNVYVPTTRPEPFVLPDEEVFLGYVDNKIYTNDYLGCSIDLSQWNFTTADKLQALPENLDVLLNDERYTELKQIQVLRANQIGSKSSIQIQYQLLNDYDRRRYAVMTEEEIIDALLQQKDVLISMYAQSGISEVSMEKKTVTFLGEERTVVYTTGKYQGHDHFIVTIYDYRLGRYSVSTAIASTGSDLTDMLLSMFEINR